MKFSELERKIHYSLNSGNVLCLCENHEKKAVTRHYQVLDIYQGLILKFNAGMVGVW